MPGPGYSAYGQAAQALAAEITSAGGTAPAIGACPRRPLAPSQLIQAAAEAPGPGGRAVLASNDRLSHLQPLQDITATQLDQMLAVNLRAPFLLPQRVAGSMREPGSSRILLIFRAAAFTGGVAGPHHARPRPGCTQLTHFLASRLAATGITVNALAPALAAETRMLPGDPAQLRGRCRPAIPGRRPRRGHPRQGLPDQPGHLPRRRHLPQTGTGRYSPRRRRPGRAPADIGSAVIHDRYHQDDDRYAAETDIHPRSDDAKIYGSDNSLSDQTRTAEWLSSGLITARSPAALY
jgi:3-oxoacyl-[acyl-carrier protein] reductase